MSTEIHSHFTNHYKSRNLKMYSFGPRGAGIRRLTGRQKIQGNQYQKERLIRRTGQSGHGSGDSGPKWLAHPRPENHAEEKSSHPQRRGPRRNPSSGLKEELPTRASSKMFSLSSRRFSIFIFWKRLQSYPVLSCMAARIPCNLASHKNTFLLINLHSLSNAETLRFSTL